MIRIGAVVAVVLLAGLAGCSEDKPAAPEKPAATEPATPPPAASTETKAQGTAATAPAADAACPPDVSEADRSKYPACDAPVADTATAPADQACPPDVSEADRSKYPACDAPAADAAAAPASSSDVSQAAIDACLKAVDAETDGDVAVLSTEFSEANSMVMVGVGADKAPWKCLVSNDGSGAEVSFAGDEGAL